MIQQLKEYDKAILAIKLKEGFTENDFNEIQKLAKAKREKGFDRANILIKLDELKITESSGKAILDQIGKVLINLREFGRIAVVGDSKLLEKLVAVDNFFLQKINKGSEEKYFDVSALDEALQFVEFENKTGI